MKCCARNSEANFTRESRTHGSSFTRMYSIANEVLCICCRPADILTEEEINSPFLQHSFHEKTVSMRSKFGTLSLLLLASQSHADNAAIERCRQISEATQRLSCYDAIVIATPAKPYVQPNQDSFGLVKKAPDPDAEIIESELAADLDGLRPNETIRLKNGQIWRVTDDSTVILPAGARKVKIRRGLFGAFFIEFEGINHSPKVKRIQ